MSYNQFIFTPGVETFSGSYVLDNSTISTPNGNIFEPGTVVKFNNGDPWLQSPMVMEYLNSELSISTVSEYMWTNNEKSRWILEYFTYLGIINYLDMFESQTLIALIQNDNLFNHISAPSLAYINRNDNIDINSQPVDLVNGEVNIGLNVYPYNIVYNFGLSLPDTSLLKEKIMMYCREEAYISNACLVTYKAQTEILWCFGGYNYKGYITPNSFVPSLLEGGGNWFSEIKLAGSGVKAHYIVRAGVDPNDPTYGLLSGHDKPFCMGEIINIIDTTTWTILYENDTWTYDNGSVTRPYIWDIADVSNPCVDYSGVPITELIFPLRIIQFCEFGDFK
jgi:hypothetical protein